MSQVEEPDHIKIAAARRAELYVERRPAGGRVCCRGGSGRPIGYSENGYASHLAAARKGRIVERLRVLVWTKNHGNDISDFRTSRELARRKAAAAVRSELKYLSANEIAKQIGAIKLGPPDAYGHKRAAADSIPRDPACAAVVGVWVREDRVGQPRGLRAAVGSRAGGARAFANIPAVIGPRSSLTDLFPRALADIVDEEPGP